MNDYAFLNISSNNLGSISFYKMQIMIELLKIAELQKNKKLNIEILENTIQADFHKLYKNYARSINSLRNLSLKNGFRFTVVNHTNHTTLLFTNHE